MLTIVETLSFVGPMKLFKSWSGEKVAERRKMTNSRPDIMGYLLEHTEDNRENRALLDAESRVIIGAGRYGSPRILLYVVAYQSQRYYCLCIDYDVYHLGK
jgi:hypothetical protein